MRGLAISSFLGICALVWFTKLPEQSGCLLIVSISILISGLLSLVPLGRKYLLYTICFFLSFSYACWTATSVLQAQLPPALEGKDLQVIGSVHDLPERLTTGYSFFFHIDHVLAVDGQANLATQFTGLVRLTWYAQQGTVLPALKAGERWQLVLRAKRPNGLSNPGGFDYERWLFAERILATGYVRAQDPALRLSTAPTLAIDPLRERISEAIHQALGDQPSTSLIQGLAVSATAGISKKQWQILQATGTAHLLSISGLHIAMVASFGVLPMLLIWWVFPQLYLYLPVRLAGSVLGGAFAIGYALLAGFNIPTQRSLAMILMLMLGLLLKRHLAFSKSFALALLVVLVLDPLASLSIGFWLSFGSVALLALLSQHQAKTVWVTVFTLQLGLSVFLIPMNIAFFASLPVYSPLANLLAIPWVTLLVVPLILIGILCLPLSFDLASNLWQLAAKALDMLTWVLDYLAQLPNALLYFPDLPWYYLALALLGVVLILLPRGVPSRWLGLVCLVPLVIWQPSKPKLGEFRLTVLDVGQGLATVVQTATHVLVFDTGAKSPYGFDMGEVVVAPWLGSQQIRHIDTLMVSHGDNDHRGGADYLLEKFSIHQVATNQLENFSKPINSTLNLCQVGQSWVWDEVRFEVLSPDPKVSYAKTNNQACVLKVSNAQHALLLPSDIEKPTEQALLKREVNLQADVVLMPHHGSKTSSSAQFLQAVTPKLALISAGYLNRFHHPHPQVLERYQALGINLLNTVEAGAIRVDFPNSIQDDLIIFSYRRQAARFWNRLALPMVETTLDK
ncbi:DNA internalization-related competence protein ComEC/Rec2 [uncultured Thiothrix sp.]|uniref:DNA internalization-related competence protein ComEC/Rec2 n=1 Tax=uncultured Thiothrix sp. TaxID=223185 RepID=UPI0026198548|nr:DNA internalization-related competence protein ComEC/Rec2 [uncultured Thiothrix sp.]